MVVLSRLKFVIMKRNMPRVSVFVAVRQASVRSKKRRTHDSVSVSFFYFVCVLTLLSECDGCGVVSRRSSEPPMHFFF